MPNFKSIVQQGQQAVLASDLKDLLLPLWRLIEWQGHTESLSSGVELDRKGDAIIHLYASLEKLPDAPKRVLREFGTFVLKRAGERGEAIWNGKLDAPTKEQIATVKQKIADPELRKTCKSYKDVLDTYPGTGGSVDRLVFINVMNALLANNIAYTDSEGVDIMTWGPTAEYCNLKKYHSLVPLVSAYSPFDIYNCYGAALAAMVTDKLSEVRDSSVAFALRGIVQRIARIASPE
jgi:hypothetical protein